MSASSDPVSVVLQYLAAFRRKDVDAIAALLTEDAVTYEPASSPYPGVFHGSAGYRDMFRQFHAYWAETRVGSGGRVVGDLEVAVVIGTLHGRPRGHDAWLEVPVMERFRVADGRITEIMPHYFDPAALPHVRPE